MGKWRVILKRSNEVKSEQKNANLQIGFRKDNTRYYISEISFMAAIINLCVRRWLRKCVCDDENNGTNLINAIDWV